MGIMIWLLEQIGSAVIALVVGVILTVVTTSAWRWIKENPPQWPIIGTILERIPGIKSYLERALDLYSYCQKNKTVYAIVDFDVHPRRLLKGLKNLQKRSAGQNLITIGYISSMEAPHLASSLVRWLQNKSVRMVVVNREEAEAILGSRGVVAPGVGVLYGERYETDPKKRRISRGGKWYPTDPVREKGINTIVREIEDLITNKKDVKDLLIDRVKTALNELRCEGIKVITMPSTEDEIYCEEYQQYRRLMNRVLDEEEKLRNYFSKWKDRHILRGQYSYKVAFREFLTSCSSQIEIDYKNGHITI
jgi:hypothetical protein